MSPGKVAAQAAHAETLAMHELLKGSADADWNQAQHEFYTKWYGDGHYTKYVMLAEDTAQLYSIERYLNEVPRMLKTYLVIDEGHTEGTYMVPTAMSVELVDKDDQRISSIFSTFRLYKESRGPTTMETAYGMASPFERWLIRRIIGNGETDKRAASRDR